MRTVNHLLFGNHPKAGKLKARTETIVKIMKENGGKIEATELEKKLGIKKPELPSPLSPSATTVTSITAPEGGTR